MKPVVDGLQQRYGDRIEFFVYADVNTNQAASEFARTQGVEAVPTMMLVAATGSELNRWEGSQPEPVISAALDAALK